MGNNGIYNGDDVLDIGHVRHLTTGEVDDELSARANADVTEEISDGAAAAIASWWQAARGHGYAFAQLASTGRVRLADLADDIGGVYDNTQDVYERRYMDYLATWALSHPSRED